MSDDNVLSMVSGIPSNPETGADEPANTETVTPEAEAEATPEPEEQIEADSPPAAEGSGDETDSDSTDPEKERKSAAELAYEKRKAKREADRKAEQKDAEPLKTLKDFDYNEQEFNRYLVEQSTEQAKAQIQAEQEQAAADDAMDRFAGEVDAFDADNEGFSDWLFDEKTPISAEVAMHLRDTDVDTEIRMGVAQHLRDNPKELQAVANSNPIQAHKHLLELSTKVAKDQAELRAAKSKTSKAPKPPTSIEGSGNPDITKKSPTDPGTADKMSDKEWLAARNKQLYG